MSFIFGFSYSDIGEMLTRDLDGLEFALTVLWDSNFVKSKFHLLNNFGLSTDTEFFSSMCYRNNLYLGGTGVILIHDMYCSLLNIRVFLYAI